jgi:PAS domain S-box-containing protein
MRKREVALLVVLLCVSIPLVAAATATTSPPLPSLRFEADQVISYDNEAQGKHFYDIAFESWGVAWLASRDGLYRYDGYRWQRFTKANGLPSNFIRSVCVTRQGALWVGTDVGAGVFDGKRYRPMGSDEALAGPSVRRIREDPDGTLWFCSDRYPRSDVPGGLTRLSGGVWTAYGISQGLPSDHVFYYFRDSDGNQFAATGAGIAERRGAGWVTVWTPPPGRLPPWSLGQTSDGTIIGLSPNAIVIGGKNGWKTRPMPQWQNRRSPSSVLTARDHSVVAFMNTSASRMNWVRWNGLSFVPLSSRVDLTAPIIESIGQAPDGSVWACGLNLLVRWPWEASEWAEAPELPAPQLVDHEGGVWFADAQGAYRYLKGQFTRFPQIAAFPYPRWTAANLALDDSGGVWGVAKDGVIRWSPQKMARFPSSEVGIASFRGFVVDGLGRIWLEGRGRDHKYRIVRYDGSSWSDLTPPEIRDQTVIRSAAGLLGEVCYVGRNHASGTNFLLSYGHDSRWTVSDLPAPASTDPAVMFWIDQSGWRWLYGKFGAFLMRPTSRDWEKPSLVFGEDGVAQLIDLKNEIWLVGAGNDGIFRFDGREWRQLPAVGIAIRDRSPVAPARPPSFILLNSQAGLMKISPSTDAFAYVTTPELATMGAWVEDGEGAVWMTYGSSTFRYRSPTAPPEGVIARIGSEGREGDRLRVDFRAIDRFLPPETPRRHYFSWRFDKGPWSPFVPGRLSEISLEGVGAGRHQLEVRAMNESLLVDPTPAESSVLVLPLPIQDKPSFKIVVLCVSGLVLMLAVVAIERARKYSRAEARFRELFDRAPVGYHEINAQGILTRVNQTELNMLGYSPDEMIGRPVTTFIADPVGPDFVRCRLLEEVSAGPIELSFRRKDGSVLPTLLEDRPIRASDGRVIGARSTLQDISGRKQAEADLQRAHRELEQRVLERTAELRKEIQQREQAEVALRESEERYRTLVENQGEGIGMLDPDGRFTFANPAAEASFGVGHGELLGRRLRDFAKSDEPWVTPPAEACQDHRCVFELEITRPDGRLRQLLVTATQQPENSSEPSRWLMLFRDNTDRKRLEDQLRQAQKMEAIGTLAGGIAHDFNNILTVIIPNAHLIQEDLKEHPSSQENLDQILQAAYRAKDLVQQILAFSRQQRQERRVLAVEPVLKEALGLLRSGLPSTIDIAVDIADSTPTVLADSTEIHQVIMNLCTNAAHAMRGQPGRLEIGLTPYLVDEEFAASHPGLRPGPHLRLTVGDTGHGMDAETLKRIFDPFFTTKPSGEGTGLGLAVVHGIVKNLGGVIQVYSQPGRGAVFHVYLPAQAGAAEPPAEEATEPPRGKGEHVLFIDDEEAVCRLTRLTLERIGYRVTAVTNSLAALDLFRSQPGAFDVVLTDLTMPGMTGVDLALQILHVRSDVPIILATGFGGVWTQESIRQLGIRELLIKPYTRVSLGQAITRVLRRPQPAETV